MVSSILYSWAVRCLHMESSHNITILVRQPVLVTDTVTSIRSKEEHDEASSSIVYLLLLLPVELHEPGRVPCLLSFC